MSDVLSVLSETIEARKSSSPETSYVAQLHAAGLNKILEKIGEEAIEAIIAGKEAVDEESKQALVGELADLWFHTMVLLSHLGMGPDDVLARLGARFNVSGIEEKANRSRHNRPHGQSLNK